MAEKSHLYRGSSIRAYDAESAYQKELQKRVREVEVRAMQEVVELRKNLETMRRRMAFDQSVRALDTTNEAEDVD